jgi:hypothetical protein
MTLISRISAQVRIVERPLALQYITRTIPSAKPARTATRGTTANPRQRLAHYLGRHVSEFIHPPRPLSDCHGESLAATFARGREPAFCRPWRRRTRPRPATASPGSPAPGPGIIRQGHIRFRTTPAPNTSGASIPDLSGITVTIIPSRMRHPDISRSVPSLYCSPSRKRRQTAPSTLE